MDVRIIDETGNRYGKLTVIDFIKSTKGGAHWLCLCECGNTKTIRGVSLRRGHSKSCGCRQGTNHGLEPGESMFNVLYLKYQWGAKRRNLEWELSNEQFRKLTKQNCYYCGCEPSSEQKAKYCNGSYIYNGIDRLNNGWGYTVDNVVSSCTTCNLAKQGMSCSEFLDWVERVSEYQFRIVW